MIFYGSDGTSSDPVNAFVEAWQNNVGLGWLVTEQNFVLVVGAIREHVVSDSEVLFDSVGLLDKLIDLSKLLKSKSVLLLDDVGFAEFGEVSLFRKILA